MAHIATVLIVTLAEFLSGVVLALMVLVLAFTYHGWHIDTNKPGNPNYSTLVVIVVMLLAIAGWRWI